MPWKPLRGWRRIQDKQLIARNRIGRLEMSQYWRVLKVGKHRLAPVIVIDFSLSKKRRYFE